MDIHKPKPWHGVREFLKEYLIIVVGVLTALGGEQAVEWAHTQQQIREARDALHDEISRDATTMVDALEEDRCALAWLDRLATWAKGGPRPDDQGVITRLAPYSTTVWDIAKTGAVGRMPLKDQLAYAQFYAETQHENDLVDRQLAAAQKIVSYQHQDRLTPDQSQALLETILASKPLLKAKLGNGARLIGEARSLGAGPTPLSADARQRLEALCAVAGASPPKWPAGS